MSSIIVYCQADEKICVGSGEFSTLYRGSRAGGGAGVLCFQFPERSI